MKSKNKDHCQKKKLFEYEINYVVYVRIRYCSWTLKFKIPIMVGLVLAC